MRTRTHLGALPLIGSLILSSVSTFAFGVPALADTAKARGTNASCQKFVQEFYNWYLSGPKPKGNISKYDYTLKYKTSMFSPDLTQMLQADEKASAKSPGEIVGLDFDPFLNAQDDPGHMVARTTTMKGSKCFVDVYRSPADPKETKPDVTAELTQEKGHWIFVNFHYPPNVEPQNGDLRTVLKALAADRAKHH